MANTNQKSVPPLGAMSEHIWLEKITPAGNETPLGTLEIQKLLRQRIQELSRAIKAYADSELHTRQLCLIEIWAAELVRRVGDLRAHVGII